MLFSQQNIHGYILCARTKTHTFINIYLDSLKVSDLRMPFLLCAVISLCLWFTPSKGQWVENKGLWYYISQDEPRVSYQQAASRCESMKARLAVITNQDQNDFNKENTDDEIQRWIGLSNNKHEYTYDGCRRASLVWNYDRDCDIKFRMFAKGHNKTESASCMGVVFKDGIWSLKSCTNVYGFICQWECKKIYLQFETLDPFSGIYELSYYWEGNIAYKKQKTGEDIELWKDGNTNWNVNVWKSNINKYLCIAFHESRLYVPYDESTTWNTKEGKSISAHIFCIECDKLSVCVNADTEDKSCFSQLSLKFNDNAKPKYIDETSDVIIRHTYNSYHCICIHGKCDQRCGYIFPYPKRTTASTLNDGSKVTFTNLCVLEDKTMPGKSNKTVTSISISVVVLVIIIVAVVVTYRVSQRRKFTEFGDSVTNDNISNNDRLPNEVPTTDNMYVDINESSVDNQSSETYNERQYSYADMAIPTSITPKVNISSKMEMVKVSYGAQMDDSPPLMNDNKEGIDELYAKVNKPKIPSVHLTEGSSKIEIGAKQLIKVLSDKEKVQRTDNDPQMSDDDPAAHYNGDDDLELFENSVYGSTQR